MLLSDVMEDLEENGIDFDRQIKVGIMAGSSRHGPVVRAVSG